MNFFQGQLLKLREPDAGFEFEVQVTAFSETHTQLVTYDVGGSDMGYRVLTICEIGSTFFLLDSGTKFTYDIVPKEG